MNKFSKHNKIVKCRSCGKKTHSSIQGDLDIQLCPKCYKQAGLENEHLDGRHDLVAKNECNMCQSDGDFNLQEESQEAIDNFSKKASSELQKLITHLIDNDARIPVKKEQELFGDLTKLILKLRETL